MTVETISPSGEKYIFKEPKYIKIVVKEEYNNVDDGFKCREIIYWFKQSTKPGRGWYLNSQEPKKEIW